MKWKAVLILLSVILLNGCMDFTRYKTGKVVEQGKVKLTLGEGIGLNCGNDSIATILPKIGVSVGVGNGLEIGGMINTLSLGADVRKQIMYEEEKGINTSFDLGVNMGIEVNSINGGFTFSKTISSKEEPYFGLHYNKYLKNYNEESELFDDLEKISNVQATVGIKIKSSRFAVYPELNLYKFTEVGGDILTVVGIGTTFEF